MSLWELSERELDHDDLEGSFGEPLKEFTWRRNLINMCLKATEAQNPELCLLFTGCKCIPIPDSLKGRYPTPLSLLTTLCVMDYG